jgi:hypothetical protein
MFVAGVLTDFQILTVKRTNVRSKFFTQGVSVLVVRPTAQYVCYQFHNGCRNANACCRGRTCIYRCSTRLNAVRSCWFSRQDEPLRKEMCIE